MLTRYVGREEATWILPRLFRSDASAIDLWPKHARNLAFAPYSRDLIHGLLARLRNEKRKKVLVPDYSCVTLIHTLERAGCDVVPYKITLTQNTLEIAEADLLRKADDTVLAVIFVDFFGLRTRVSDQVLREVKSLGIFTLRDAAHSYLSLVAAGWRGLEKFDATVTSIYKTTGSPVGALLESRWAIPNSAHDARMIFSAFIRRIAKFVLAPMSSLGIDSGSVHLRIEGNSASMAPALLRKNERPPAWTRVLSESKVRTAIARRKKLANSYRKIIDDLSGAGFRTLRPGEGPDQEVLIAFPLVCETRVQRDIVCQAIQASNIDAYTWPIFSNKAINVELWEKILLVPLTKDCSKELSEIIRLNVAK